MGFLADKKILITGVLSNRSIAYGVAKACQREGATLAFTYVNADLKERVARIAAEFGTVPVLQCDVTKDDDVASLFDSLRGEWGTLDGLLHAIAFAPREALAGDFLDGMSRAAFAVAHDVSSYSLAALAKGARPLMKGRSAAMVTLTYLERSRAAQLQRDGPRESEPRGERPLPRVVPWPRGIRVNGCRRADQDAGRGGHRRLLEDPEIRRSQRADAPQRHGGRSRQCLRFPAVGSLERHHGEITYVDNGFSIVAAGLNED
jgi:enoyl-[acyl-carrier protein] reductase I